MPGINVQYNATSLQTATQTVNNISHDNLPNKNNSVFALARQNLSKITASLYPQKTITIEGQIFGSSVSALETALDTFKAAMTPAANTANLDIDYAGGTRRYVATVQNLSITRGEALFAVGYSIEFLCADPWGRATSATTLKSAVAVTVSPSNQALTIGGTAPEQFLIISYTLTSFTGTAFNTIYFKNNTTGVLISITRTWVAGDVVTIDIANKSVQVNGVEVDYDGVFPVFSTGSHTLVVSDNWSARSVSLTVTQLNRYL